MIAGTGFRSGLEVALNGARLRVLSVVSHEIRAGLPALPPGSYRLVVDQRRGGAQRFVVTLGLGGAPGRCPAGAAGGLTVVASHGTTLGTLVTFGMSGQPSPVALQDNGVWRVAPVNPEGMAPMTCYALFADGACATTPDVPLDTNPAPLLRLLQTVNPGDTTGYYAGNPTAVRVFASLSLLRQPAQCQSDRSRFPAPFTLR